LKYYETIVWDQNTKVGPKKKELNFIFPLSEFFPLRSSFSQVSENFLPGKLDTAVL
jgi:hypothetical protein